MAVDSLPDAGVAKGLTRLAGEIWNLWPGWSAAIAVSPISITAKTAKTGLDLVIRPSKNLALKFGLPIGRLLLQPKGRTDAPHPVCSCSGRRPGNRCVRPRAGCPQSPESARAQDHPVQELYRDRPDLHHHRFGQPSRRHADDRRRAG